MEPRVRVEVVECRALPEPGRWRVSWLVRDDGSAPLELQAAWIPHGRFRGDGRLVLACHLQPGASTRLEFNVTSREKPGTAVENAFLILRLSAEGRAWRILSRMRVEFDAGGIPEPVVELITTQALA